MQYSLLTSWTRHWYRSSRDGHKFIQDNDSKHTSNMAKEGLEDKSINRWKTLAKSPDLNPIENLWHELKEYIRRMPKVHERRTECRTLSNTTHGKKIIISILKNVHFSIKGRQYQESVDSISKDGTDTPYM